MAGQIKPDIILLDINIGDTTGFDLLPLLYNVSTSSRIIAFSMHDIPGYVRRMIREGAKGYVTKSSPPAELREAIFSVYAGEQYICREMSLFRYTN
jgi:two-component system, NarL family, invasion response regulator UvrY